ncbi:MAG: polyprenyl synthetase family protein [bacterium]|nr:polyprenyl synthetase family protein [bacterium]
MTIVFMISFNMMDIIQADITEVRNIISSYVNSEILNGELKSFVLGSSKMIRTVVAILFLKSYEIELTQGAFRVLAAGEIIHNASLLHDDIIDNSKYRRGEKTIGVNYSNEISILSGDYLLGCATECLLDIQNPEIIRKFKNCTQNMCVSEFKQFSLRGKLPTFDEYISICEGKTATLFSTIMESIFMLAGKHKNSAIEFGKIFGLLFQIDNDLQKDSEVTDIKNNIYTLKDIIGIEKTKILSDNYKEELLELIKDAPNESYRNRLEGLIKGLC